jgi:DnaK suppressor protein
MTLTHKPTAVGPLSTSELIMLREMLEQQRAFRLDQLSRLDQLDQLDRDMIRLRSAAELEVDRSLRSGAESALREVDRAIARLQAGTYGKCTRCATPLEIERLEVPPHVALCMQCQRERVDQR